MSFAKASANLDRAEYEPLSMYGAIFQGENSTRINLSRTPSVRGPIFAISTSTSPMDSGPRHFSCEKELRVSFDSQCL